MTEPKHTNHLALEKSPYLKQHAHNPIDWYPWGKEAFDLAKSQDKPVFLSIGYATCHWCHVMERESFESEDVAKVLNDVFVCIKVDREELPEVDSLYMELAQALMSSAGGWPLNVILTPDLKPFFAVTYLPAKTQKGLIGLTEFAKQIQMLWMSEDRAQIVDQAEKVGRLQRAWVAVCPSLKEGWGLTNIEANACGTPVVASNVPGLKDSVVDGDTGLLFEYGDTRKLSDHLAKVLSDANHREKLTKGGLNWASKFSWDHAADKTLELIEEIVASPKGQEK